MRFDWPHTAGIHDISHMDVTTRDTVDTQLIRPRYVPGRKWSCTASAPISEADCHTYRDVGTVCGEKEKIGPHPTGAGSGRRRRGALVGASEGGSDRSPEASNCFFPRPPAAALHLASAARPTQRTGHCRRVSLSPPAPKGSCFGSDVGSSIDHNLRVWTGGAPAPDG